MLDELETLLASFRAIGAGVGIGTDLDGSRVVWGIQCGQNAAANDEHASLLPAFPRLRAVGFQATSITNRSLRYFAELPLLETLDLARTSITDTGLGFLAPLKCLEYLHLEETSVTEFDILELQRQLPNCEICSDFD